MTTRREFLSTGAAFVSALPVFYGNAFCSQYNIDRAKEMYDPGRKLVREPGIRPISDTVSLAPSDVLNVPRS